MAAYDQIGHGYASVRRPDPRLAALIAEALDDAETVLNVGAGAGSYEPADRRVVAVEPSAVMLAQHPAGDLVQGTAERLPFADGAFDAAMAVMTVHHWNDLAAGLAEMKRVSSRQLVFTWDPDFHRELWIVTDYVPQIGDIERSRFAPLPTLVEALNAHSVLPFEIPWDFQDGYQPAYWRRPEQYLDPVVRAASSTFAVLDDDVVEPAMSQLRADLNSGLWARRYGDLLAAESMDYGHRLIVA